MVCILKVPNSFPSISKGPWISKRIPIKDPKKAAIRQDSVTKLRAPGGSAIVQQINFKEEGGKWSRPSLSSSDHCCYHK